jgi:S-adenosylmethionine hydrolase
LRPICFLSDYGLRDEWVGVCRGVIERICPGCTVIDVAHDLPAGDIRHGAFVLENALPFVPHGVLLAVVDPGVGTSRRAVALRAAGGPILVGPDNGLLWPAAAAAGGVVQAVDIAASGFCLQPVSATFHGRDVFSPVAAQLARGAALDDAGERIDPATLTRLEARAPEVGEGTIRAAVRLVDRFGNVQLQARRGDMEAADLVPGTPVDVDGRLRARYGRTFADVPAGAAVLYEDSSGWIAVALNGASAAAALAAGGESVLALSR